MPRAFASYQRRDWLTITACTAGGLLVGCGIAASGLADRDPGAILQATATAIGAGSVLTAAAACAAIVGVIAAQFSDTAHWLMCRIAGYRDHEIDYRTGRRSARTLNPNMGR